MTAVEELLDANALRWAAGAPEKASRGDRGRLNCPWMASVLLLGGLAGDGCSEEWAKGAARCCNDAGDPARWMLELAEAMLVVLCAAMLLAWW